MAKHAWDGYVKFAWGENELKPVSKRGHTAAVFGKNTKLGATIVDSLDTLYLMGLKEEFDKARNWIHLSLDLSRVCDQHSYTSRLDTVPKPWAVAT